MKFGRMKHRQPSDDFQSAREIVLPPEIPERALVHSKVFGTRKSSLSLLSECQDILEVGVLAGDFSMELTKIPSLKSLTLLDNFSSDDWPWIEPPRFTSKNHLRYIEERFKHDTRIRIIQGESSKLLSQLPSQSFDFIYIDANHSYEGVKRDCDLAIPLLINGGYLCFNDYIMHDYRTNRDYGIVRVVNELLSSDTRFEVAALALNNHMFSDIYLKFNSLQF